MAGDCYQNAADMLLNGDHPLGDDAVLCHGIPTGTGGQAKGKRFGHAWLEDSEGCVVQDPSGRVCLAALYYSVGNINPKEVRRYTRRQAQQRILKHETWGPWHRQPKGVHFIEDGKVVVT